MERTSARNRTEGGGGQKNTAARHHSRRMVSRSALSMSGSTPRDADVRMSTPAFSAASRSRPSAIWSLERSTPCEAWNFFTKNEMILLSKSSPPRKVSPFVDCTSRTPCCISRMETSKVPPPRSYTAIILSSSTCSIPYANAAAVGSLMMRCTSNPAIAPASRVACRCASLKYAGTVTTADGTEVWRWSSAVCFILARTSAPTCEGEYLMTSQAQPTGIAREDGCTVPCTKETQFGELILHACTKGSR